VDRSLPPSPRRLELARRAGAVLTSPAATAGLALAAALAATAAALAVAVTAITRLARDGWTDATRAPIDRARAVDPAAVVGHAAGLAAPIAITAAAAAVIAAAVLARGLIVPRRRVPHAPAVADDASARATDALIGLVRLAVMIAVGLGFVVTHLAAITGLVGSPAAAVAGALRDLGLGALTHVAVAAVAASVLELTVRAARRRGALRMTVREARDEQRATAGDPALRGRVRDAGKGDLRPHVADAVALLVGDDDAVAIGWRPGHEPRVLARGRGAVARGLRAAARARRVPITIAPPLAAALAAPGPIPARDQPALATVLAALGVGPR